jgi:hypothetical protein
MRLMLDDIDEIHGTFGGCACCQAEGAYDLSREINDIMKMDKARETRR